MPVTYFIDTKERLIRTRCLGDVTLVEVLEHFRTLEGDPKASGYLDVFLDLSETTSVPLTREISAVTREVGRVRKKVRFNVCAVVATRNALFGMLRMFEVLAGPFFSAFRVFRDPHKAAAWLMSHKSRPR